MKRWSKLVLALNLRMLRSHGVDSQLMVVTGHSNLHRLTFRHCALGNRRDWVRSKSARVPRVRIKLSICA